MLRESGDKAVFRIARPPLGPGNFPSESKLLEAHITGSRVEGAGDGLPH